MCGSSSAARHPLPGGLGSRASRSRPAAYLGVTLVSAGLEQWLIGPADPRSPAPTGHDRSGAGRRPALGDRFRRRRDSGRQHQQVDRAAGFLPPQGGPDIVSGSVSAVTTSGSRSAGPATAPRRPPRPNSGAVPGRTARTSEPRSSSAGRRTGPGPGGHGLRRSAHWPAARSTRRRPGRGGRRQGHRADQVGSASPNSSP